jgi:hypothetical protein
MKNLQIILLALLVFSLYSSVSVPSESFGTRSFGLDLPDNSETRYFYISYPYDMGYQYVSEIDRGGVKINIISEYSNSYFKWRSASYESGIGWVTDFPIKKGGAYSVHVHAQNAGSVSFSGKYEELPSYNLVSLHGQFYYKGLNFIMMPQTKDNLNTAVKLGSDLYDCDMVSKKHYLTNAPLVAYYDTLNYTWNNDFTIAITDPLFVNVRSSQTWPRTAKDNIKGRTKENSGTLSINTPMPVYYSVQDNKGKSYSFGSVDTKNSPIKFKAWITGRENEILTHEDYGCGFEQIGEEFSAVYINLGNFETQWQAGEEVNFHVTDEGVNKAYIAEGCGKYSISDEKGSVFRGFEPLVSDTGDPIVIGNPAGGEESLPYTTSLYQNYPNPFNPVTTIKFSLENDCIAKLKNSVDNTHKSFYLACASLDFV